MCEFVPEKEMLCLNYIVEKFLHNKVFFFGWLVLIYPLLTRDYNPWYRMSWNSVPLKLWHPVAVFTCLFMHKHSNMNIPLSCWSVRRICQYLQTDQQLGGIFTFTDPPQLVYSRGKNLKDLLVHSDLILTKDVQVGRLAPIRPGNYKCNSCAQCNCTYTVNAMTLNIQGQGKRSQ